MRYRIILYERATDDAGGIIDVPRKYLNRVLAIAGINDPSEPGEFPLDEEQIGEIAQLVGFSADTSRFHYHLEPVAPALANVSA